MRSVNETDLVLLLSWLDKKPHDRIISIVSTTYGPLCGFVPEVSSFPPERYVLSDSWFDPFFKE